MAIAGFALFIFGVGVILVIVAPIGKRKNKRCSAQTQGTLREIRGRDSRALIPNRNKAFELFQGY